MNCVILTILLASLAFGHPLTESLPAGILIHSTTSSGPERGDPNLSEDVDKVGPMPPESSSVRKGTIVTNAEEDVDGKPETTSNEPLYEGGKGKVTPEQSDGSQVQTGFDEMQSSDEKTQKFLERHSESSAKVETSDKPEHQNHYEVLLPSIMDGDLSILPVGQTYSGGQYLNPVVVAPVRTSGLIVIKAIEPIERRKVQNGKPSDAGKED